MDGRSDASSLRPAQALPSPAWVLALVVLIANDHWLKRAGLVPDVVTGKLSDVAGMIVAPTLLATLLRVRGREGLAACHVAVGLVFASIQLSPSCAALWTSLTGLLGYPWTIVADPTDLLALPVLALSWVLLTPHMAAERRPWAPLQRSAVAGLAALGLWATVATTEGPEWEPTFEDVFGNVYINNDNDDDISLHIRHLREAMVLDCDAVADDPGRLLSSEAFGEAEQWLLPARANVGVEVVASDEADACGAAWIAGEGIEPTIVFMTAGDHPRRWFPGRTDADEALEAGGMRLTFDADNRLLWTGGDELRFTPRTDAPAQPEGCDPPPSEARIEWSTPLPSRPAEILALDQGPDGCFEFELQDLIDDSGEIVPFGDPHPWYLCAPASGVPFAVGEVVAVDDDGGGGTREVDLTLVDATNLEPATDNNGVLLRMVRLLHGGNDPQFIGPAVNRELEAVRAEDCAWLIEPSCPSAERTATMRVVGDSPLPIGEPVTFPDGSWARTLTIAYMREQVVIDTSCATGSTSLSYDIDLALVEEPTP